MYRQQFQSLYDRYDGSKEVQIEMGKIAVEIECCTKTCNQMDREIREIENRLVCTNENR